MMENHDCKLEYECNADGYHRITSQRLNILIANHLKKNKVWPLATSLEAAEQEVAPEKEIKSLSIKLDADAVAVLAEVSDPGKTSDENRSEFNDVKIREWAESVVRKALSGKLGIPSSDINVEVIAINKGSLEIEYRLNCDDEKEMEETAERIRASTISLDHIEFRGMMFPVISMSETNEMSLSEAVMVREVKQMKKREEEEKCTLRLKSVAAEIEKQQNTLNEIRDPLRVMAAEAKGTWTEERKQFILLRRKELQEQQLQMMKNFVSHMESLLRGNVLEWQQDVLERVEQLRKRKAFPIE